MSASPVPAAPAAPAESPRRGDYLAVRAFNFWYGRKQVLFDLDLEVPERRVTAFIGPSGCGKSTLLRSINRLNDLTEGTRHTGEVRLDGRSVYDPAWEVVDLRRRIGMVFQRSNPFPLPIYENVVYSLRVAGRRKERELDEVAEKALRAAALWDEVKDRLHENALRLSGGQMQRLCIARALAAEPEVLLMDEPCSFLDPIATGKIEELIHELRKTYTIVIITHNMQQAARISDRTAFFYLGRLVEVGKTDQIFMNPQNPQTEAYVSGRFG